MVDLVPGRDDEGGRDGEQHRQRDVEPVPGEAVLLPLPDARLPLGPVVAVAELDRGRRPLGNLVQVVGWPGHRLGL